MRVYRYESSDRPGGPRVAIAASGGDPVDLGDVWPDGGDVLGSVAAIIERGPELWSEISDRVAATSTEPIDESSSIRWLTPLDRLSSLRDFLAFEDHVVRGAERRGTAVPERWYRAPVYYKGNHRSIIGPDEPCRRPAYTSYLDFELELAMVVGRRGRDIEPSEAGSYIFGFTVMNDFSARDVQAEEMSAWLGPAKGKDFATALGPCIVTTDELGAEPDLEMICRVNGTEWGRSRSGTARWKWADMIAHVSADEDIYPGDVYGSGTPGGCCGLDIGRRLETGDVVELEIEGIGILRNEVVP
ncbi:MAG TPA: fumarylacetoacetate hydrolase family protein [Actinomycetota bacterium]|nr:fumarylacetoacetate hydrolase family protein [Actinomycetota bacterium]